MEEEADASPSPRSRLSDPLSRLSDVPGSSCSSWSGSNPGSPRLPPRRPSQSPPLHRANIDWQERCMELQLELHRYRHQAVNVRDMLKDKVSGHYVIQNTVVLVINCCKYIITTQFLFGLLALNL